MTRFLDIAKNSSKEIVQRASIWMKTKLNGILGQGRKFVKTEPFLTYIETNGINIFKVLSNFYSSWEFEMIVHARVIENKINRWQSKACGAALVKQQKITVFGLEQWVGK